MGMHNARSGGHRYLSQHVQHGGFRWLAEGGIRWPAEGDVRWPAEERSHFKHSTYAPPCQ